MRKFVAQLVCAFMGCKVALLREALETTLPWALVRFLTCVDAHVSLQVEV